MSGLWVGEDGLLAEWGALFKSLGQRFFRPFFQPAYVFYFIASMVIGATGIWVALAESWLLTQVPTPQVLSTQALPPPVSIWADPSVFKSILTYFAALGSLSCIQVIVIEDKQKSLRSLLCILLLGFIGLAILATLYEHKIAGTGHPFLMVGTVLAIITWWIANWDDARYTQSSPLDPLGGNTENAPAGDTEEYAL